MSKRLNWGLAAIASIWVAVVLISIFSPDLVSGSQQEHFPVAAFLTWFWGCVATVGVMIALLRGRKKASPREIAPKMIAATTAVTWLVATLVSIFGPVVTTGSDPTKLPLAAIFAPVAAAILTGLTGLFVALVVEE